MDRRASELVGYSSSRRTRFRVPVSGMVGRAFAEGRIFNLRDAKKHKLFNCSTDQPPNVKVRSMLLVPVVSQIGAPIGLMQAVNRFGKERADVQLSEEGISEFLAQDEQILTSLAGQVRSQCAQASYSGFHSILLLWR